MRPTTSIASGAALVTLALAGCGLKKVDDKEIERVIQRDVAQRAGVTGTTVDCPANQSADAGTEFDCTVTQSGIQDTKVRVTMKDGGKFSYGAPRGG